MTAVKTLASTRAAVDPWGRSQEQAEAYQKAREDLNAAARDRWDDPEFHRQVAADLESILDYQFTFENLFGTYLDVQNVGEFDKVTLRERRGLKVFYRPLAVATSRRASSATRCGSSPGTPLVSTSLS